jgi:hypothetical protein
MRTVKGLVFLACAIATTGISPEAMAAVLCQKKSGVVVARPDACKKKETPVDVNSIIAGSTAVTNLTSQVTALSNQVGSVDTMIVTESDTTPASTFDAEHTVACPTGYKAIGGGVAGEYNQIAVDASGPTVGGQPTNTIPVGTSTVADGWFVRVFSFGGDAEPFKVSAICVKLAP